MTGVMTKNCEHLIINKKLCRDLRNKQIAEVLLGNTGLQWAAITHKCINHSYKFSHDKLCTITT